MQYAVIFIDIDAGPPVVVTLRHYCLSPLMSYAAAAMSALLLFIHAAQRCRQPMIARCHAVDAR